MTDVTEAVLKEVGFKRSTIEIIPHNNKDRTFSVILNGQSILTNGGVTLELNDAGTPIARLGVVLDSVPESVAVGKPVKFKRKLRRAKK